MSEERSIYRKIKEVNPGPCDVDPKCGMVEAVNSLIRVLVEQEEESEKSRECYRKKFDALYKEFDQMFSMLKTLNRGFYGDKENNVPGVQNDVMEIRKFFKDHKDDLSFIQKMRFSVKKVIVSVVIAFVLAYGSWQLYVYSELSPLKRAESRMIERDRVVEGLSREIKAYGKRQRAIEDILVGVGASLPNRTKHNVE